MRRVLLALCILACALLAPGRSAIAQPTEYELKAVFLLNFARYVEWPERRLLGDEAIRLCVLGRDPFDRLLAGIEGREAQGHPLEVSHIAGAEQASGCHMLFLSASEERRLGATLRAIEELPILTVSDIEGFAGAGGGIGFATVDDRVRFDVNVAALHRVGLKASAQLLRIARRVIGSERGAP